MFRLALSLLLVSACVPTGGPGDSGEPTPEPIDCTADADGDGLDDCAEADLGTDPDLADTDGDGFDDADELDCVSDPLDADESCYACGWPHADPGTLQETGSALGDVLGNISGVDQCGEDVALYDLLSGYRLLFITTVWCGACKAEARELGERTDGILEATGVDFSYAIVLFQDATGGAPVPANGEGYWSDVGEPAFPVLANEAQDILDVTPYDGTPLPGKCVISPAGEIVACNHGHGEDDWAADAILDHLGR